MDLLKAELERKKKRTSELVTKAGGERGGRRFVRRGEAAKLEKEEREAKQSQLIRWGELGRESATPERTRISINIQYFNIFRIFCHCLTIVTPFDVTAVS